MKKSFWVTIIILALVVFGFWGITGYVTKGGVSTEFVSCLAENDAVFYGASWCPICQDQKTMFGRKATKELYNQNVYVECTENAKLCESKGVTGYPTWIVKGERYEGLQSLEKLSALTGCELDYE